MSNFGGMSSRIVALLKTVQLQSAPAFADVQAVPTLVFSGWPAASVVPADNLSEYANIAQNLRTYVFDIDIYYAIGQEASLGGTTKAFTVMMDLVDAVLDALDNSNDLGGFCDMTRPVPSVWSMVQASVGDVLTARITLQCAKTVAQGNG